MAATRHCPPCDSQCRQGRDCPCDDTAADACADESEALRCIDPRGNAGEVPGDLCPGLPDLVPSAGFVVAAALAAAAVLVACALAAPQP